MALSEKKLSHRLPACILNESLLQQLWELLAQEKCFTWEVVIGTGGDLLGMEQNRPHQIITDMNELKSLACTLPRLDRFWLIIKVENKGTINLWFNNYARATGNIEVIGEDSNWIQQKIDDIMNIIGKQKQVLTTMLYSKMVYAMINSVIPLVFTVIFVFLATLLFVPGYIIRQSDFIWWIATINILIIFKLASILSNYLLKTMLIRFPYIKWQSIHLNR